MPKTAIGNLQSKISKRIQIIWLKVAISLPSVWSFDIAEICLLLKPGKINSRQVIKLLKNDGWIPKSRSGSSHIQFIHPKKKGKVTVADHGKKEIPPGTLNSILKQAGLK